MRTLRSKKLRAMLYLSHNGKCAICGIDLIKWHADHIIPFALTKTTHYDNMQPLCVKCNLKKGKKMTSPKNNNYFESLNLGVHVDIAPFRIGQKGAFNCIVEKIIDHNQTVSIVLPTRYGKSDVIRASAIELIERGLISGCLVAAPCKFLRDQLTNKRKIEEMISRYSIGTNRPISYDILDNFRLPIFQNDEYFVSLTTQMLALNADEICKYINLKTKMTGKPIVVYIDESHSSSDANTWGAVVPKIIDANGIVVLLTATPFRDDGFKIPGFKCIVENKTERKRYVPRTHDDPSKYWVDIYNDIEGEIKLIADYEYTFKSAWAEGNVICKVARREFDVVVKIPLDNKDEMKEVKISEMTTTECGRYFGRVVRDKKVIAAGVSELLKRLDDYRMYEPLAQAIIFCGNDIDEEDNGHANQIANEINCNSISYKVVIATSKQDEADDLIKRFSEGKGDILIVKQMASLGLDIPAIKIGLDLSAVRTLAAFIQRMMRTGTMWGKNQVAHLIIPSDVNGKALWTGFIEENGGSMTNHETTLIESKEKDKTEKEENSQKTFEVIRTEDAILSDSSGGGLSYTSDYDEFAQPLLRYEPKLQAILTDHELVLLGKKLNIDSLKLDKKQEPVRDITEQRILLKNRIKAIRNQIASKKYNYSNNQEGWKKEVKDCMNRAKRASGILLQTKLDKITNIPSLEKLVNYLEVELNSSLIEV